MGEFGVSKSREVGRKHSREQDKMPGCRESLQQCENPKRIVERLMNEEKKDGNIKVSYPFRVSI